MTAQSRASNKILSIPYLRTFEEIRLIFRLYIRIVTNGSRFLSLFSKKLGNFHKKTEKIKKNIILFFQEKKE